MSNKASKVILIFFICFRGLMNNRELKEQIY
jgi:hypothetical protein